MLLKSTARLKERAFCAAHTGRRGNLAYGGVWNLEVARAKNMFTFIDICSTITPNRVGSLREVLSEWGVVWQTKDFYLR